ncbi:MAG: carbohydrate ABC transporter permease [Clostridiaceae bacterium]|nr:carbohydrate ABC transporter permease [Clostridiaceae bacterium]
MKRRTSESTYSKIFDAFNIFLMLIFCFLTLYPFWNIIAISFATYSEYLSNPLLLFPKKVVFDNYIYLMSDDTFIRSALVTVFVTVVGVLYNMLLNVTAAYGLSKKNLPGYNAIWGYVIFTMFFSGGLIPSFILVAKWLGLMGSIWAVILPYGVNVFNMIVLKSFFDTIPSSLEESAKIDGANDILILVKIIIPISMPAIATFILFFSVDRWNEWFNVMLYIQDAKKYTLQFLLRQMIVRSATQVTQGVSQAAVEEYRFMIGIKMAAIVLATLPIICVYPFLQKHFVKGIMIGAIKG